MRVAALALIASFAWACVVSVSDVAQAQQGGPSAVGVDRVRLEPLSQTTPVLGRLVARQAGPVAAQIEGAIAEIEVLVGDRVEAGDPLARIDETRLRIDRDLAEADLKSAQAAVRENEALIASLEDEQARISRLQGSAAFSAAALQDKANEITVARARLAAASVLVNRAQARLRRTERDLTDATVRAPFPGVVTLRAVAAGDYVRIGDDVVTLVDDTNLEIEADVTSNLIAALSETTDVTFRLDDDTAHDASVRAILPEENPLTRTRAVRFDPRFGDVAKPLATGQSATLMLPIAAPRDIVSVAKDAVINRPGGSMVFVAADGEATPREVEIGEALGGRFEVVEGLEPGELVVVRGNERLRPGQEITYDAAEAPEDGGGGLTPSSASEGAASAAADSAQRS